MLFKKKIFPHYTLAIKSIPQYRCKILTRNPKGGAFTLFPQPHHRVFAYARAYQLPHDRAFATF